jgi:tRNA 2-thiouridine synthesizing protein E
MELNIAGVNLDVTEDGYLNNLSQWNKEVAIEIAKEEGIELTDKHWEVIAWLQDQVKKEKPLSVRGIKKSGVVDIKQFYALFPEGPLKKATRIAGVPKPKSCI